MSTKLRKQILALTLFTYSDKSSEENIKKNLRLAITSENWQEKKEAFIEERFSQRKHEAWNLSEWAKHEREYLNSLEFEEEDRQVLRDRYSRELSKIIKQRLRSNDLLHAFKWKGKVEKLRLLHELLKKEKYIQATWKEFEQLFNGQEASRIKPIQWRATQWELGFFIELLLQKKLIAKCNHVRIACQLFIGKNGLQFKEASLKSQMSEARKEVAGNSGKHEKLKALISCLIHL